VAGASTARNPVQSSMSSSARGSRRKIAYFTRSRVVETQKRWPSQQNQLGLRCGRPRMRLDRRKAQAPAQRQKRTVPAPTQSCTSVA
jgi:hypothetical protein